jgi:hypothetical protein
MELNGGHHCYPSRMYRIRQAIQTWYFPNLTGLFSICLTGSGLVGFVAASQTAVSGHLNWPPTWFLRPFLRTMADNGDAVSI